MRAGAELLRIEERLYVLAAAQRPPGCAHDVAVHAHAAGRDERPHAGHRHFVRQPLAQPLPQDVDEPPACLAHGDATDEARLPVGNALRSSPPAPLARE